MYLHEINRSHKNKTTKRVGRGGKRGAYSGRGMKGQGQHASSAPRPEMRDIIKKIPKKRGYRFNSFTKNAYVVNLNTLEKALKDGDTITPGVLRKKGIVMFPKGEKPLIKILGTGDITKKITVKGCLVSASAAEKISKAGGSVLAEKESKEGK
ncbi:MAG: uL15 family ribosomal protein [Candidatus Paceibacterota bacterium]